MSRALPTRFPKAGAPAALRACVTLVVALACAMVLSLPAAASVLGDARAIEPEIPGFPERAQAALLALLPQADAAPIAERSVVYALAGQASVLARRIPEAHELADRIEAAAPQDPNSRAAAALIRSSVELATGEASKAAALAQASHTQAVQAGNADLRYGSALTYGTAARSRGQSDQALSSLQEALSLAEAAGSPYRRSMTLYQISVLQTAIRNAHDALEASLAAYRAGEQAKNGFAMANARMAESAAVERLDRPSRELASMQEALAIARDIRSRTAESRALVNLADIRLRRKQYNEAMRLSRDALRLAEATGNTYLKATSKANLGFALLGAGRIAEGKRYADEALNEYERTGQTAEIAELAGEYGRSLEAVGDYRGALAHYHRERKLIGEIAFEARQRILLEMQEKYESEKHQREIALLARENALQTAEIANQSLRQRVWWLLAALFALSFSVVTVLYRKLRVSNAMLARKNDELSFQSSRDPLTGLFNRRHFQNLIAAEAAAISSGRRADDPGARALLLIDLDHFKETNDRHGHALGDAVLVAVAGRLRESLRESDTIVRWGGEEFLVVARTSPDRLDDIASRILRAVAGEPIVAGDRAIRTSVSIGYVPLPLPPTTAALSWDRAIGLVDMALYLAKMNGRNRAYGIQRLSDADPETLAATERDLEHAWKSGRVEVSVLYGPPPVGDASAVMRRAANDTRVADAPAMRRTPSD
ncbi:MAG: GGDEF domain-containing protein [Burkholderiales bacterium]|nr:GGDEF domain-containing protein [Burkholderiales bacterium]